MAPASEPDPELPEPDPELPDPAPELPGPAPELPDPDPQQPNPDPELFREVFGRFATGVAVVTSAAATGSGGMTANAVCSLSLEPLLALVCFENNARTLPIVREAERFGVNVLAAHQEDVARVFASKVPESEKLQGVAHRLRAGVPIIDGALSWVACELRELIAGGDHTIAIGEVVAMGLGEGDPLLWYAHQYHDVRFRIER